MNSQCRLDKSRVWPGLPFNKASRQERSNDIHSLKPTQLTTKSYCKWRFFYPKKRRKARSSMDWSRDFTLVNTCYVEDGWLLWWWAAVQNQRARERERESCGRKTGTVYPVWPGGIPRHGETGRTRVLGDRGWLGDPMWSMEARLPRWIGRAQGPGADNFKSVHFSLILFFFWNVVIFDLVSFHGHFEITKRGFSFW